MRYVLASYENHQKQNLYMNYVANSVQLIPQGKHIIKTYYELLTPTKEESAEDIVVRMITQHGLKARTE